MFTFAAPAKAGQFAWDHFPSCEETAADLLTERMAIARVHNDQRARTLVEFPLDQLVPIHSIPRPTVPKSEGHVTELMKSLRANGYWHMYAISVIHMPDGRYFIGAGHHRVAAMKRLGETTIPAEVYEWSSLNPRTRQWYLDTLPEAFVGFSARP